MSTSKKIEIPNSKFQLLGQQGFSLLELVLYVAILGVIVVTFSAFAQIAFETRIKNQVIAEVEQQGAQVAQLLSQSIRNASAINSPTIGTNAATLSLNTPTASLNPTLFYVASPSVMIKEGAAAEIPLTNDRIVITGFTVSNLSRPSTSDTLRIQFTAAYINPSGRNEYDYSASFIASATRRP